MWSSWTSVTTSYTISSDCGHLGLRSPHATLCPVIVVILDFGHHMLHYVQWLWYSWISVTTCYTMSSYCGHHGFRSPHATLCPVSVTTLDFCHHMLHYVQWLWSSWISVTTCYTMSSDYGHLPIVVKQIYLKVSYVRKTNVGVVVLSMYTSNCVSLWFTIGIQ